MNYQLTNRVEDGVVVTYVIAENGKAYRLEHVLNVRNRDRVVEEIRKEYSARREWWRRKVLKRDDPNCKAYRQDYGDGGSGERNLIAAIDYDAGKNEPLCVRAKRNCCRISRQLMLNHWHQVGRFVAAVWRNGIEGREETMAGFGLSEWSYLERCKRYARLLGWKS